jgi:nucleotide-binding universal stress UspA family protein
MAAQVAYRTHRSRAFERIVVPVGAEGDLSTPAVETAARLASKRGTVVLVSVLEVPRELPLDALFPDEEDQARWRLRRAAAIVESYGVHAVQHLERGYGAASTVLELAEQHEADLIVLGAPARTRKGRSSFGRTATAILHRATCRVMLLTRPSGGLKVDERPDLQVDAGLN